MRENVPSENKHKSLQYASSPQQASFASPWRIGICCNTFTNYPLTTFLEHGELPCFHAKIGQCKSKKSVYLRYKKYQNQARPTPMFPKASPMQVSATSSSPTKQSHSTNITTQIKMSLMCPSLERGAISSNSSRSWVRFNFMKDQYEKAKERHTLEATSRLRELNFSMTWTLPYDKVDCLK